MAHSTRMTLTLDRTQRDALWREVESDLAGWDPRLPGLEDGDIERAQRCRRRYEVEFALLDGLGWWKEDDRTHYELSVHVDWFREYLEGLRADAAATLEDDRRSLRSLRSVRAGGLGIERDAATEATQYMLKDLELFDVCDVLLKRIAVG